MLDTTVPYFDIFMKREVGNKIKVFDLHEDFSIVPYQKGDEYAWAEIEVSVGEFADIAEAMNYFTKNFLHMPEELQRRMMFVVDANGSKVATATAWWGYTGVRRYPQLHWVAVKPSYQGNGIGRAISSYVTALMLRIEGDQPFYLTSQTWSHKALAIYEQIGYVYTDELFVFKYKNDKYKEAMNCLHKIFKETGRA